VNLLVAPDEGTQVQGGRREDKEGTGEGTRGEEGRRREEPEEGRI
jgi:hypothetical protein